MRLSPIPIDTLLHIDFTIVDPATGTLASPTSLTAYVVAEDSVDATFTLPSSGIVQRSAVGHYRVSFRPTLGEGYMVGLAYSVILTAVVNGITAKAGIGAFLLGPARVAGTVLYQDAGISTTEFGVALNQEAGPRTIVDATTHWKCGRAGIDDSSVVTSWTDHVGDTLLSTASVDIGIASDGAVSFPGESDTDGYMASSGYVSSMAGGTGFTLGLRFKLTTLPTSTHRATLLLLGNDTPLWEYYVWVDDAGALFVGLNSFDTAYVSSVALTTGTWYNVVIVFDGSGVADSDKLKVWINGSATTMNYDFAVPTSITPEITSYAYIGGSPYTPIYHLEGDVAQVFVSQRAATTTEVTQLIDSFVTAPTDMWKDALLSFTSGPLQGQVRKITAFDPQYERVTLGTALTATPDPGDGVLIVNQ